MTKNQTLEALGNQLDSFYSLEQVIGIIKNIEESSSKKITIDKITDVIEEVVCYIEYNVNEIVDLDNAEFEISYSNQLECTSVGINSNEIRDLLIDKFSGLVQEEQEEDQTGYVESECN